MERQAFINFTKKYVKLYENHDFQYQSLDEAITTSKEKKIPLLLYFHVDNSKFSKQFLSTIEKEDNIYEKFTLLPWDIVETHINKHLIEVCTKSLNIAMISDRIHNQTSALFVINVEEQLIKLNQMYEDIIDAGFFNNLILKAHNNEIIVSRKLPQDFKNQFKMSFKNCKVKFEESIISAKNNAIKDEVPLILYYYNSVDTCCDTFNNVLVNEHINDLLNNFRMFVYDQYVENGKEEFLLKNKDLNHKNVLQSVLSQSRSCIIIYYTIDGTISSNKVIKNLENEDKLLETLYDTYIEHNAQKETNNKILESNAIANAIDDMNCPLFQSNTLKKSIELSLSCKPNFKRKILVLYYHNSHDIFWSCFKNFLNSLDKQTKYILENLYYLLPWDVTEKKYKPALKLALELLDFPVMTEPLMNSEGSLYCFFSSNDDKYLLFNTLKGEVNLNTFRTVFTELAISFANSNDITALDEYTACQRSSHHLAINKYTKPLDRIINEYCLCFPVKSRKLLLIQCYNRTHQLSMDQIKDSNFINILNKYEFISWDTTDSNVNKSLKLAVKRHFGLKQMENLINKKPALYVFMPICESLTLVSCIIDTSILKICNKLKNLSTHFLKEKNIEEQLPENRKDNFGPTYLQQMFYDQLGNRDYDCFQLSKDEGKHMKSKIAFAYFGQPEKEKDGTAEYKTKQQQKIDSAYKKILLKAQEFGENTNDLVFTCIYNCLTPLPETKLEKLKKDPNYNPNLDFHILPVFIIRKCINSKIDSPCRFFIDSDLREYNSWVDYLNENIHPKGIFIAPLDGKYQGNDMGKVRIQFLLSPACGMGATILKRLDIGTAAVGVGAGIVGAATFLMPVAPIALLGAGVAGVAVGIYTLTRNTSYLFDRYRHGENMSVQGSEARAAYFNVIACTLGFTGAGATYALAHFAQSGADIGLIARGTINGLTAASVLGSGAAVANATYEVFNEWNNTRKRPSTLTLIQLSSSILFFGHAVYNVRAASTIILEAQAQTLQDFNQTLKNNKERNAFNKITKETIRVTGDVQSGQAEVILYIKNLNNKDEVFSVLTKANKQMNKNGVRFSVNNGEVNFNGMKININEFGSLSKIQQNEFLLDMPKMPKPTVANVKIIQSNINQVFTGITIDPQIINIVATAIKSGISSDSIADIFNYFSPYVQDKILMFVKMLLEEIGLDDSLNKCFIELVPINNQFLSIVQVVIDYFKNNAKENNNIVSVYIIKFIELGIITACKSPKTIIKELLNHFNKWLVQKIYTTHREPETTHTDFSDNNRKRLNCTICQGYCFSS